MADVDNTETTPEAAAPAPAPLEQTTQEEIPPTEGDTEPSNETSTGTGTPTESGETESPVTKPEAAEESNNGANGNNADEDDDDDDDKESEDDRKLFVGGLSWETQEKSLKEYMSKFGEIESCIVKSDNSTGRSRGFGFVVFSEIAGLQKALEARPHEVDGRQIDSKKAEPQRREGKLFVGGVKPETEEKVIMEYFSQFGKIVKIDRPLDGRKKPKGFCFITFSKDGPISKIIKKRYHQVDNKEVECKYADPPHEGGGGRGRGRGRGGQSQFNPPMQWFGGYGPTYPYGGGYGPGPGYGNVGAYGGGGFASYGSGGGMYGGAGGYSYGPSGYGKSRGGGRHQNNYKPY